MRRIGIGSGSLVSNTAVSLAGLELSQLGADEASSGRVPSFRARGRLEYGGNAGRSERI